MKRKCQYCDVELVFIETADGKPMPCEAGEVTMMRLGAQTHRGWITHWSRCPGADKARKQQKLW